MTNMKLNINICFSRFTFFVHFVNVCVNVFQIFNFFSFQFAGQLCQCLNISIFCVHFFNLFSLFLLQLFFCVDIVQGSLFSGHIFLFRVTSLAAGSPVLARHWSVMVTRMQRRDLEMKQTLFIALFHFNPH